MTSWTHYWTNASVWGFLRYLFFQANQFGLCDIQLVTQCFFIFSNPDDQLFLMLVNTSLHDSNSCYRQVIYLCTQWCNFRRLCIVCNRQFFLLKGIITWHITCILFYIDFICWHCTNTGVELKFFLLLSQQSKPTSTELILAYLHFQDLVPLHGNHASDHIDRHLPCFCCSSSPLEHFGTSITVL